MFIVFLLGITHKIAFLKSRSRYPSSTMTQKCFLSKIENR
jgi:hypothetical protein